MTTSAQLTSLADDMAGVLEGLCGIQDRFLAAIDQKLEAMRRCDVSAMSAASALEGELAADASLLDERRCWLAVELSKALGLQIPPRADSVSLRSLCSRLDAARGGRLAEVGARLREKMLRVAESNRVVDLVCREMMAHFKAMFGAMILADESPKTYSHRGAIESRGQVSVLDAVG